VTAGEIARALGGRRSGAGWMARCPAHGDRTPSLALRDGSDGRVLVFCHAGCSQDAVIDALRRRGLWPTDHERVWLPRPPAPSGTNHQGGSMDAQRIALARQLWAAAKPIDGTPGETYLRTRGILIKLPSNLRFAMLNHREAASLLPCLLARVDGIDGGIVGVHRTFLRPDGRGKAQVPTPRMALGAIRGGAVRLGPTAVEIGLAEGIENALSAMQLHPGLAVWAGLCVGNLASISLPPEVTTLRLFLDGDAAGSPAARAAAVAALAHMRSGRRVYIHRALAGMDWNDVLQDPAPRAADG